MQVAQTALRNVKMNETGFKHVDYENQELLEVIVAEAVEFWQTLSGDMCQELPLLLKRAVGNLDLAIPDWRAAMTSDVNEATLKKAKEVVIGNPMHEMLPTLMKSVRPLAGTPCGTPGWHPLRDPCQSS